MYVVLWSVYLSGTACGLVWSRAAVPVRLWSLWRCFQRHAAMYVCMYGQQVQRSYIVVVLFWRPDLTLL